MTSSPVLCTPQGNNKALATVTAIIDGMGSIGAAVGPMLTGYISEKAGFDGVFVMLYSAAIMAGLLLVRLCAKEVRLLICWHAHKAVDTANLVRCASRVCTVKEGLVGHHWMAAAL